MHPHIRQIPPFSGFTEFTPFIPKMYWNVDSQEQRIHAICEFLHKLKCYAEKIGDEANISSAEVEALEKEFEKFKESGFTDYYEQQLNQWMNDNAARIFQMLAKMVWFGLTLDGHFVAYIPESWSDIVFDTGADYELDTYGRLILRWNVDNAADVDQTPEIVRPSIDDYIATQVRNIMTTLYSTGS